MTALMRLRPSPHAGGHAVARHHRSRPDVLRAVVVGRPRDELDRTACRRRRHARADHLCAAGRARVALGPDPVAILTTVAWRRILPDMFRTMPTYRFS